MTSEEKTEASQPPTGDPGAGSKPETTDLIERAHSVAERLEKANLQAQKIVERHEQLMAKALLGGRSDAGNTSVPKTPEQELDEKAEKMAMDARKRHYGF